MQRKRQKNLVARGLKALLALVTTCIAGGEACAGEVWNGSNLTIYGSSDPTDIYVKRLDGETLSAGWIKIGTELGCASLVAVGSTITLSDKLYIGWEQSPGYTNTAGSTAAKLTASLFLTNTALTCATDFTLGYNVQKNGPISAEIGPGSVVTCLRIYRYANPSPTLTFTGGRMAFGETSGYGYLCQMEGHTWAGGWPNDGVTMHGAGAPIDLEVRNTRKLVGGWASRHLFLTGNGGLVKRGAGKLIWGWFTYGSNNGTVNGTADYTGDTVIKAGGIEMATPSSEEKKQIRYSTPAKSALKIEEGAYFDFAGNTASFLGVSGDGLLTNSAAIPARLTLGSSGGDGSFSPAHLGGAMDLVKAGAGTLTVSVPFIDGNLHVSNGTVKVAAGTSLKVKDVRVEPCATLDVRGVHVECGVLSAPRSAHVLWDADTVFDCTVEMDGAESHLGGRYGFGGALRKTGEGTLTLFGQSAKVSGSVAIEEGTVACKPLSSAWPGKYFIINFYRDVNKDTHTGVAISEFFLYGADGNRVNEGAYTYTEVPAAETQQYGNVGGIDDATQLEQCEVAVWMPNHNGFIGPAGSPPALFDGKVSTSFRFTWYWNDSNKFVFRITNSAPEVVGFSFATDDKPERRPTQWKLWGSEDGSTWTKLADNSTNTSNEATWTYLTNSTPDTVRTEYDVYPLDLLAASSSHAPFGEAEVSVANGATLDFASAEMSLARLKVDMDAGGGTITRFTPGVGGVIDLVSASSVSPGRAIPLTVAEVASPVNLKSWTVKVNGNERADLGIRWSGGTLRVSGGGLSIIFR